MTRERKMLRLFALFGFLLVLCRVTPAQSLRMPPHEKFVLKNGLTVLLMEKRGVPLINVFALVKT
jgi:predicted Zn-dependent peptidase